MSQIYKNPCTIIPQVFYKNEVITIRKVNLTMKEEEKYLMIKKLVDTNGNKKTSKVHKTA